MFNYVQVRRLTSLHLTFSSVRNILINLKEHFIILKYDDIKCDHPLHIFFFFFRQTATYDFSRYHDTQIYP